LLIASYALAYFISVGTNCFKPIPHPFGVVTVALRWQATAKGKCDEKAADVVLLGSHITAYRGSSRRSEHR
jgi:hypothetical protein